VTLDKINKDWTKLGEKDPLWAVLVDPSKRNGGWDPDEFLATGQREVDVALARLDQFGGTPVTRETALDFGCGAGRLSQALAKHYEKVIGIDISAPMLATARRLDRTGGRCVFVHNTRPELATIPDASVDLVFTSLVLQHVPPDLAETYLREFGRVIRPGGALVALMPAATRATIKGLVFRYAPHQVVALLQKRVLGYPAPMRMTTIPTDQMRAILAGAGLVVLGAAEETGYGDHWHFIRYYAVRPGIPTQETAGETRPFREQSAQATQATQATPKQVAPQQPTLDREEVARKDLGRVVPRPAESAGSGPEPPVAAGPEDAKPGNAG